MFHISMLGQESEYVCGPVLDKVGEVRVGGDAVVLSNFGKPPVELVTVFVVVVVTLTGIALSKSSQSWVPIL